MENSNSSGSGIGFAGVLTIVFVTLKLLGNITWSWWWVLSPMWISFAIGAIVILSIFLGLVIGELLSKK